MSTATVAVPAKTCAACRVEQTPGNSRLRAAPSGRLVFASRCRPCEHDAVRAWRAANPDGEAIAQRRRFEADPERFRAYRRAWAAANPERRRAARRRNYERYADERRAYAAAYRRANLAARVFWQRERVMRQRAAVVVPFTREQLSARLSMFPGCWLCGEPADTVDHVKPLSKGGAHALANLRPACRPCNSSKGARWPIR